MKRENKIFLLLLILCMVMFAAAGCRKEPDRPSQTDGTLTVDDWESGTSGSTDWDQTEQTEQIGFAPRKSDSVKPAVSNSDRVVKETIVNNTLQSNMNDARNDFKTNKSFMGALEFLNSQASIALIQNRGKKFEALA